MKKIPLYSYDLINDLNKNYPEKCPDSRTPDRDIWIYSGKRELINQLLNHKKIEEVTQVSDTDNLVTISTNT